MSKYQLYRIDYKNHRDNRLYTYISATSKAHAKNIFLDIVAHRYQILGINGAGSTTYISPTR